MSYGCFWPWLRAGGWRLLFERDRRRPNHSNTATTVIARIDPTQPPARRIPAPRPGPPQPPRGGPFRPPPLGYPDTQRWRARHGAER